MKIVILSRDKNFASIFQKMIFSCLSEVGNHSAHVIILNPDFACCADLFSTQILFFDMDSVPSKETISLSTIREHYPNLLVIPIITQTARASIKCHASAYRYLLKECIEEEISLCLDTLLKILSPAETVIQIRGIYGDFPIESRKISYFEGSARRRVYLHTISHSVIECRGKLADYTSLLQGRGFLRLQRSYLANMFHILEIKNYLATLDSGERLKTTEKNYAQIRTCFYTWKNNQNMK